jgi:hypothetical protein
MMLRLHPDTREVAVVSGSGPRDRQFADVFRRQITPFGNRVAFSWLTNLSGWSTARRAAEESRSRSSLPTLSPLSVEM